MRCFMLETRRYAVKTARNDDAGREVLNGGGVDLVLSSCLGVISAVKTMGLLLPPVFLASRMLSYSVETDATVGKGAQSPVEILSAVRILIHQYKLERQRASA